MMDAKHIYALETRLKWFRWAELEGSYVWSQIAKDSGASYPSEIPAYVKTLREGDTFYMNSKFCSLVDHARLSIPDEILFDPSWVPSTTGWMWLEAPFDVPDRIVANDTGETINTKGLLKIAAIGWFRIDEGTQVIGRRGEAKKDSYHFCLFIDFRGYKPEAEGFGCGSFFTLMPGDNLKERIYQFETESIKVEGSGQYPMTEKQEELLHEIRWVYSGFYLMSQRLAMDVRQPTDRATKRRFERDNAVPPELIRVVTLRRLELDKKKYGAAQAAANWHWQWEVRGHWRNQWYAKDGLHKPKFIEAYIKGPQDKPIKPPGHKLFLVGR